MKEFVIKLDKPRPLLFSLSALKEINKRYGSMDGMEKVFLSPGNELEKIDDFVWIITMMVNQGVLEHNMDVQMGIKTGELEKPITEDLVNIKLKPRDLMKQKDAIFGAITQGCMFESDEDPEAIDPDLAEIQASKNA